MTGQRGGSVDRNHGVDAQEVKPGKRDVPPTPLDPSWLPGPGQWA